MGYGDHDIFFGDQVFESEIEFIFKDNCTACIAVFFQDIFQFFTNNGHQAGGVGKNLQQVPYDAEYFFVFRGQFFLLKTGQPVQTHIEDFLGLYR